MKYRIFESHHYNEISHQYHTPPLISKIIDQKGFDQTQLKSILNPRLVYHDFSLFSDSDIVLDRIEEAITNNEKICIYGDYDCDGILATSILVQGFLKRGVQVGYHIPHRYHDGYGLNVERVVQIASKGYTLIITVDNGIKAYEAIDKANELGVDVIVSDHHEFEEVPDACAIIHTKISPDYPFKPICGGFIAYKLAVAMNHNQHDKYLFSLAAITTISDMMPLLDENRSLVKRALSFMNEAHYPSLELLLGNAQNYDVHHIGFIIAPKINSFGRLPELVNPNVLVKYFFKNASREYLVKVASVAGKVNSQRQSLTNSQYNMIEKDDHLRFLYYGSSLLHEGIIGLIANKYTREYELPSFVMHLDENTGIYKGSARSVDGFSIHDFFEHHHQHLITYGGHDKAGGFSLKKEDYEVFKQEIMDAIQDKVIEGYTDVLLIDGNDISLQAIESLKVLEPFGEGNSSPLFLLKNIPIVRAYTLSEGKHLKFDIEYSHVKLQAIAFNKGYLFNELQDKNISIIGTLSINEYRNIKTIQFIIKDINPPL